MKTKGTCPGCGLKDVTLVRLSTWEPGCKARCLSCVQVQIWQDHEERKKQREARR